MGLWDWNARKRAKRLATEIVANPVLPLLGWTKAIESVIGSGDLMEWVAYAVIVTVLWIFGDHIRRVLEETAEEVADDSSK